MRSTNLDDLALFVAVAEARGFTPAARRLGMSQSALSHAIRALEERVGVRLLARTTRSVAPTEAGERLLATLAPRLAEIETELAALRDMRDSPSGTIRITASEHAAVTILYPAIARLLPRYPDLGIEVSMDNKLTDIVEQRFDAGIRLGENLARDMVAVKISPDLRMAVAATPDYFARHPAPHHPSDLTRHNCIGIRLPTHGGLLPWEFDKQSQSLNVRTEGQFVSNNSQLGVPAVLDGLGLGYSLEDLFAPHVAAGRLVRVLEDWCEPFPGYYLYYPSRRQHSAAFVALIEELRWTPT
jgi:DNA-binding transcriptional LysR family regulator